jgi:sigma-E factor negative regulatory protein RseC
MIEETATVVEVKEDYAIVETGQQAACGSCHSAGSCSTSVLSGLFKPKHNQLMVFNPIQAKPGEEVVIGLRETALLKVSFVAYLLPLLCMMFSAIAIQQLAVHFDILGGELPTILGGLLGLLAGLILFKRITARKRSDPTYQAVILRQANLHPVRFI